MFGWYFANFKSGKTTRSYSKEQVSRFVEENHIYLSSTRMVYFVPRLHIEIWFQEFREQYSSLEEARRQLLLILENRLEELEHQPFYSWCRKIPIKKYLNWRFWRSREQRMFREGWVKLTQVTYQNSQWRLELDSVDEKHPIVHKYGTFILDEDYNVIDVLGEAAEPEA